MYCIIVAMKEELIKVKEKMVNISKDKIYNIEITKGKIGNKECILALSGIGKVNAARTTQVLIDNFDIELIINTGSAGALNDNLNIGDVVITKHVVQHDFNISVFGHPAGYIPEIGVEIKCDEIGIKKAKEITKRHREEYKTIIGVGASGDLFCTKDKHKNKIRNIFKADVVEMEGAAIGQVSVLDKIPFINVKSVSDVPNESNYKTFEENLELAASRAAEIVEEFCNMEEF